MNIETVQAFAEKILLASNSFDAVVSRLAPHHFLDPAEAVREMARLANHGGSVAVIDLEGNEDPVLDALNHEIEVLHDPTHVRSYSAPSWRQYFEKAALTIETLESGHTELPGGLSIDFGLDGHIDRLKAVWFGMPLLQLFQNVAGPSAADYDVSTADELFRHGQSKSARHPGQGDDFGTSFHWLSSFSHSQVRRKKS